MENKDLFTGIEPNYPMAVDPATGKLEVIGRGRIAVIGPGGVKRLVTLPNYTEEADTVERAVQNGQLTYGA